MRRIRLGDSRLYIQIKKRTNVCEFYSRLSDGYHFLGAITGSKRKPAPLPAIILQMDNLGGGKLPIEMRLSTQYAKTVFAIWDKTMTDIKKPSLIVHDIV